MHIMWRSTHINYAQLQLQLLVGVVEEGNEIKGMLLESILCKELVLSAAPPFAMMHTSYVKLKLKRQTTGGHRPALS